MKTILAIFAIASVLIPDNLQAFYSFVEMNADELKKNPSIKIRAFSSGDHVTFIIALRQVSHPEIYWHSFLHLVDAEGVELGTIEMRGEDMYRVIHYKTLGDWDWQEFEPAEVFRFKVHSNMLTKSRLRWQNGPRSNEQGVEWGSGLIRSSYLQALADAAENVNITSPNLGSVTK